MIFTFLYKHVTRQFKKLIGNRGKYGGVNGEMYQRQTTKLFVAFIRMTMIPFIRGHSHSYKLYKKHTHTHTTRYLLRYNWVQRHPSLLRYVRSVIIRNFCTLHAIIVDREFAQCMIIP